ncbi:DUF4287 domain-containing protein [Kibdelosporangium aridum]|uniref:DUF4287 domain-containing protein n=1 Tax=Kibdelosporangium aridum TaxID=2030 RepID=A0A1Y5WYT8_KIBAR|nr:DUF4287 domain-containing protein [Kibdelosporangium aridum]SMC57605.1 protein of unknown function [Kibdelosporangium aridum]
MNKQVKRTSVDAVRTATGRDWDEWNAELDAWGATGHSHKEIVAWLMDERGVGSWWAQSITVAYEQARGLRSPGSGRDGLFTISVSKTVDVPVDELFKAFMQTAGEALRERTSQPGRSARFDWEDGRTRVNVGFDAKGPGKSVVAVAHERLESPEEAERMKAMWRERLATLKAHIAP